MSKNKLVVLVIFSFFFFVLSVSGTSAATYTSAQCLTANGSYVADDTACIAPNFIIGDHVSDTGTVNGICCASNTTKPACTSTNYSCVGNATACTSIRGITSNAFTCSDASRPVCCFVAPPTDGGSGSGVGLHYQLLEKIPGTENISGSDLPSYVSAIYKVALVVVTLSAVLMLSVGGFMYLTSAGNVSAIGTAKGIIYDSLIGLVIALSAWLILYIINPDLVQITLNGLPPAVSQAPPAPVGPLPSGSLQSLADQILRNGNITLSGSGDCKSPGGAVTPRDNITDIRDGKLADRCSNDCQSKGTAGCTENNTSLSSRMLAAIVAVGQTQRFTITSIAGGPHAGNSKHFSGTAIDISPVSQALMDAFISAGALGSAGRGGSMCENKRGENVGCSAGSGADHIHLVFPS